MNIWIINPYDELPGEGPEQRYGYLSRLLTERGHEVLWVSSAYRHRGKVLRSQGAGGGDQRSETENSARVLLIDAPVYKKNISVRRLWSQWVWGRRVEKEMMQWVVLGELGKPDIVLSSSPPLEGARAGLNLARKFGAKSIVDIQDLWPEAWLQAFPNFYPLELLGKCLLFPWAGLAKDNLNNADRISATSHTFAERARELGFKGKVHVCYLGATTSPTSINQLPSPEDAVFHILYLGAMGHVYDIETLLQAALLARQEGCVWRWSFVGSDIEDKWQVRAQKLGLVENVKFTGYLQGEDLDRVMSDTDVGVIPMDPRSGVVMPNKAGDYLSRGLPVVSSLTGELSLLLENSGAGIAYKYGNEKSVFLALKAYADSPEKQKYASRAAMQLFEKKFHREKNYSSFTDWVTEG